VCAQGSYFEGDLVSVVLCPTITVLYHNSGNFLTALLFVGVFAELRKATVNFVVSVRPSAWNNSALIGWNFMKCDIRVSFENLTT